MKLIAEPDFPELQRDPRSGVWYVRKFSKGRGELFKSTGERKSKSRARAIAQKILGDWLGTAEGGRITTLFSEVAREVLRLKRVKSARTEESAYYQIEGHLIPAFGHYRIDQITEALWEEYLAREIPTGRKIFNTRKHMVMVMRHAYKKGIVRRQLSFRNPDPKIRSGRVFSDEEIYALLREANDDLRIQILMAYTMGMRKGEILGLAWDRVDLKDGVIHLRSQDVKTRQARSFACHPDVLALLRKRFGSRKGPWVFPNPRATDLPMASNKTAWRACKRRAQERHQLSIVGRFHDLRHTFLTRVLLEHKQNPLHVSVYAGVRMDVIERVYLHPSVKDTHEISKVIRGKFGEKVRNSKKQGKSR